MECSRRFNLDKKTKGKIVESPVTETTISGDGIITVDYQGRTAMGEALKRICLGFANYYEQDTEGEEA